MTSEWADQFKTNTQNRIQLSCEIVHVCETEQMHLNINDRHTFMFKSY